MQAAYIYNRAQDLAGFQFLDSVANYGYNYWNSYIGMAILDFQKEMDRRHQVAPDADAAARRGFHHRRLLDRARGQRLGAADRPADALHRRPDSRLVGLRVLQPTLNKLITHNLLFDFTLPTGYIGAGFDLTSGKWVTKMMLAQMNQNANASAAKGSVLTARVDYARGEYQGFGMAGVYGQAPNFVNGDRPTGNTTTPTSACSRSMATSFAVTGPCKAS